MALSWVALSGVPSNIAGGVGHVMVGVARFTVSDTFAVPVEKFDASVGANVTLRVCEPADKTVPAAGEYTNEPGVLAVAFNCAAERGVP